MIPSKGFGSTSISRASIDAVPKARLHVLPIDNGSDLFVLRDMATVSRDRPQFDTRMTYWLVHSKSTVRLREHNRCRSSLGDCLRAQRTSVQMLISSEGSTQICIHTKREPQTECQIGLGDTNLVQIYRLIRCSSFDAEREHYCSPGVPPNLFRPFLPRRTERVLPGGRLRRISFQIEDARLSAKG